MPFSLTAAKAAIQPLLELPREAGLDESFAQICQYLDIHLDEHADPRRFPNRPQQLQDAAGLSVVAAEYLQLVRRPVVPDSSAPPSTQPDEFVSIVLQVIFEYSKEDTDRIKQEHKHSMTAENCVGSQLKRYLESVLRPHGWCLCSGIVKSIDFIRPIPDGTWEAYQVMNRNTTENKKMKELRRHLHIERWYRFTASNGKTRWDALPEGMQALGLSEKGFEKFLRTSLGSPPEAPEPSGGLQAS